MDQAEVSLSCWQKNIRLISVLNNEILQNKSALIFGDVISIHARLIMRVFLEFISNDHYSFSIFLALSDSVKAKKSWRCLRGCFACHWHANPMHI